MEVPKKRKVLSALLICCLFPALSSAASIAAVQSVNNSSAETVSPLSEDSLSTSSNRALSSPCPVSNNHCICLGEHFHRVCCKNINDSTILQEAIANLTENTFVLELGSLNLPFFPLHTLENQYLVSMVISNSTFETIFNITSPDDANNTSILHHLSLENITTSEWSWSQFSFLRRLDVLFVYNTTIGENITTSLGNNVSNSLKFLSIAETNVSTIESGSFSNLKNMTYLRISHSKLRTLTRDILPSPSNLESLRLDHNLISSLPDDMFINMGNLSLISLSNNKISIMAEDAFRPIWKPNVHLELRNNPLKCDCRMLWVVTSPTKPKIVGECAHPKRLFGRTVESLTEEDINCE